MIISGFMLSANTTICDQVIDMKYYKVCYSYKAKSPTRVSYRLTRENILGKSISKRKTFRISKDILREYSSCSIDYKDSGYDRGHLASDASFDKDDERLRSTYFYINVVPMHRRLNRYYWAKAERFERLVALKLKSIKVTNIVVFSENPKKIGLGGVFVPYGFYKLIEATDGNYSKCFYYKNSNEKLEDDKLKDHVVSCQWAEFT